jgi:hypothetical protein
MYEATLAEHKADGHSSATGSGKPCSLQWEGGQAVHPFRCLN